MMLKNIHFFSVWPHDLCEYVHLVWAPIFRPSLSTLWSPIRHVDFHVQPVGVQFAL